MAQEAGKTVTDGEELQQPREGYLWAKIYTPFQTFYDGEAKSVTAKNDTGVFDVLAQHHNFITMLLEYDVAIETPDGEKTIVPVRRGLMHVKDNRLTLFMDV